MSKMLSKLIRLAGKKNTPVILYDSHQEEAMVLMNLDMYERLLDGVPEEEGTDDFGEETETASFAPYEDFEEDDVERTNEELALWKAKREEKEREEIERALEDELKENPLPDPFEEDFLHTPEWHKVSDVIEGTQESWHPTPEPSYHPLQQSGSLSWSDWSVPEPQYSPIPRKKMENFVFDTQEQQTPLEDLSEEPVFLEEPIS